MLQFVRKLPIRIVIHGALSQRRGFLFEVSAGFSKALDPLSGMSANLILVDQWMAEIKVDLEGQAFYSAHVENFNEALFEIFNAAREDLRTLAQSDEATLESLSFQEVRGLELFWDSGMPEEELVFSTAHYIESFQEGQFELLKIRMNWLQAGSDVIVDYGHEGFKLLRHLRQDQTSLVSQLKFLAGALTEENRWSLHSIEVLNMAQESSILINQVDFK